MIIKCEGSFVETEVDGEIVLMDLDSGLFYSLEDTGLAIWRAIDGTRTADDIAALMAREFGESIEVVSAHVNEFIKTLAEAGLVKVAA